MQLIPVLDILNGLVVRGMAGQRDQYRPIESPLTKSTQALDIARAIRARFGFPAFYLADLDAIVHGRPNADLYQQLIADGFRLMVDAGVYSAERVQQLLGWGVERVIIALESCPTPQLLQELTATVPVDRLVFSLDLMQGVPLASEAWSHDPLAICAEVARCGISRVIILDLAGVGTGGGVPTLSLCQQIRRLYGESMQIITGGGVNGRDDLQQLEQSGIDGVLIASILHRHDAGLHLEVSSKS